MKLRNKDFIDNIPSIKSGIYAVIGLNGTGKTYLLNKINDAYFDKSLLINGSGLSKENQSRKMLHEQNRGNSNRHINSGALENIDLNKYKVHSKSELSSGQIKLNNIVECIENYIKNKSIILLDEPDVNLDTKLIVQLIELLKQISTEYNKVIIIVTHNPHLLETINIDIDNIYIKLNNQCIVNTTKKSIYDEYIGIMTEKNVYNTLDSIQKYNDKKKKMMDRAFMRYGGKDFQFLEQSIDLITHYSKFYESIFFRYVILFEGQTESEIIKYYMKSRKFVNNNIMFSKERAILYMCIYSRLCIDVTLVLDRDSTNGNNADRTTDWNNIIDSVCINKFNKHVVFMENNIEVELGIEDKRNTMPKDLRMAYIIENDANIKSRVQNLIDNITKSVQI